jgi:myo-inositol-1(or 4)-monophosphatase
MMQLTHVSVEEAILFAKQIAREAWQQVEPYYRRGVSHETKGDGTPVTVADLEANMYLIEQLQAAYPEDGTISEEDAPIPGTSGRIWYLDPIDGTKGFINRSAHCAVQVGLCEDGRCRRRCLSCTSG